MTDPLRNPQVFVRNVQVLMRKNPAAPIDEIKSAIDTVPAGTDMNSEFIEALENKQYEVAKYLVEKRNTHTSFDDVLAFIEAGMPIEGMKIAIDALESRDMDSTLSLLLGYAIAHGRLDTVKYLVDDKGVNPNGFDGQTYFIEKAIEGYDPRNPQGVDLIKYMIEKVDPKSLARRSVYDPETTPLHLVAERPGIPVAIIEQILDKNPGMIDMQITPQRGADGHLTALHLAALNNNVPVVQALVNRGANTQLKTSVGRKTAHAFATDATIKGILNVGPDPAGGPPPAPGGAGSNPGSPGQGGRRRTRSKSRHTRRRTRRRNRI